MTEHGTSGRDLARLALAQYKNSPRREPSGPRRKPTRRRSDAGSGRDPQTFAAVLNQLNTDREWGIGVQGGNILDQWPALCPDLATTVQPAHYDAQQGRLDLRPASHAYAAQLRLLGGQLAKRINDKLGTTAVRTIRVLAPGPITPTGPAAAAPESAERPIEPAPVRTRDDASPGYHHTLAAISRTTPAGQKPRLERDWGTGEYAHLRESEEAFTDGQAALETAAAANQGTDPDAVRQAAIRIARTQKSGQAPPVPTAFQRSA